MKKQAMMAIKRSQAEIFTRETHNERETTMATKEESPEPRVETADDLVRKYIALEEQAKQRQGLIAELDKKIDMLDKKELDLVRSASGR